MALQIKITVVSIIDELQVSTVLS